MRRDGILALAALGLALLLPCLQRVRASGAAAEAPIPGAAAVVPLAGEVEVGGRRVKTLLYRVDEDPEAHLRQLLSEWEGKPVHVHAEAIEGGYALGVVDVHAGIHWVHTIRAGKEGGAEVVRGRSRLLPAEAERPGLLEALALPEGLHRVSRVRDRVDGQEIETSVYVSSLGAERLAGLLRERLSLSPCDTGEEEEIHPDGANALGTQDGMPAKHALCGRPGEGELRLRLDPRGEEETWILMRRARRQP